MAKKYDKLGAAREQLRETRRRQWNWRVRHMVAIKLAWFRQCVRQDVTAEEKGRRLQVLEIAQRSCRAELWKATPRTTRWNGTGRDREPAPAEADQVQALLRLGA